MVLEQHLPDGLPVDMGTLNPQYCPHSRNLDKIKYMFRVFQNMGMTYYDVLTIISRK